MHCATLVGPASIFILLLSPKTVAQQRPLEHGSTSWSHSTRRMKPCTKIPRYVPASFVSHCPAGQHCADESPADPQWLSNADSSRLGDHAWYLYSRIIQPVSGADPKPLWRTWYNVCDAFQTADACSNPEILNGIPTILRPPVELQGLFGSNLKAALQFNALLSDVGPISQEVLFNEDAWCPICSRGLGSAVVLDKLRKQDLAGPPPHLVRAFDNSSKAIVVKAFWLVITPANRSVPYVQSYPSGSMGVGSCINWECWQSRVEVATDPAMPCGPPTGSPATVSLKCFYGYQVSGQATRVLLGLHVITHEANNWTWSTFWWHPHAVGQSSQHALPSGDPRGIQAPWTEYWMDTTVTSDTRTYNPYLEGAMDKGTYSNCIGCHQKAVYFGDGRGLDDSVGQASPSYFSGALQTDYLWSVAFNAVRSSPKPAKLKKRIPASH